MKIAIIGAGISGLTAAALLHPYHEITVFEANDYLGGHTHTVPVNNHGKTLAIDTGFIVFNDWTYPNFIKLLDKLQIASQPTSMSFSVRCDRTGLEYNGSSLNGLFAQRSNLFSLRFINLIRDILRFNKHSLSVLDEMGEDVTVDAFIRKHGYSRPFAEQYLVPMGAAIWSCPPETFGQFPMRFIIEFYRNHGLLSVTHRPQWRVITDGSWTYVKKLVEPFHDRIRLRSPVLNVSRGADGMLVRVKAVDEAAQFDHVVFACHSDLALRMLADSATPTEKSVLSAFPYQANAAVLHTDTSVLPRRRRAWASWNYHIRNDAAASNATLTYNMNILQSLQSDTVYCVTLNSSDLIDRSKIIGEYEYHHPIFTTERRNAQQRHSDLINQDRASFCGAYWGNGFHEDGVNSALKVCEGLGVPGL